MTTKPKVTLVLGAGVSVGLVADWDGLTRWLVGETAGRKLAGVEAGLPAAFPNTNQIEMELAFRALVERRARMKRGESTKRARPLGERMLELEREAELAWIELLRAGLYATGEGDGTRAPYLAERRAKRRPRGGASSCPNTTLRAIASLLHGEDALVGRVITFNADDWLEYELWRSAPRDFHKRFRIVTQPTFGPDARLYEDEHSARSTGPRVPIIHAHGFLCHPMEGARRTYSASGRRSAARGEVGASARQPSYDAPNMLVFRDIDYWRTVANPSSFANVTLLDALMNSRCLFVGLSFRDINLLRWLGVLAREHEDTWHRRWDLHFRAGDEPAGVGRSWMRRRNGHIALLGRDAASLGAYLAHRGIEARAVEDWAQIGALIREAITGTHARGGRQRAR